MWEGLCCLCVRKEGGMDRGKKGEGRREERGGRQKERETYHLDKKNNNSLMYF